MAFNLGWFDRENRSAQWFDTENVASDWFDCEDFTSGANTTMAASLTVSIVSASALTTAITMASAKTLSITASAALTTAIPLASAVSLSITTTVTITTAITAAAAMTMSITVAPGLSKPTTVIKTVKTSGGDYATLAAWHTGQVRNCMTADEIQVAECYTMTDTAAVLLSGWTTDATRYIEIRHAPGALRGYHLSVNSLYALENTTLFLTIKGIKITNNFASVGTPRCVHSTHATGIVRLSHCIFTCNNTGATFWDCIGHNYGGAFYISNSLFLDATMGAAVNVAGASLIYNNTIRNCSEGLKATGTAIVAKNNLFSTMAFQSANGTFAAGTDYNATEQATMTYTVTGGGNTHDRLSQTFTFVSGTDFHLASGDAGAKDVGVDLSGDTSLPITDDFDQVTRAGTRDIGMDEFVADTTLAASLTLSLLTAAALTTAIPLASTKTLSLTVAPALATSITMASAVSLSITATAALTTSITFASTPVVSVTLTAALSTTITLASARSLSLVAAAALTTSISLASATALSLTATAALSTQIPLASSMTMSVTVAAALQVGNTISAAMTMSLNASAALTTAIAMASVRSLTLAAAASLTTAITIATARTLSLTVSATLTAPLPTPTFPFNGILDAFNRANENPLANGTWSLLTGLTSMGLRVVSNAVTAQASTDGASYWTPSSFGPDSEIYATVPTFTAQSDFIELFLRVSGAGTGNINGYAVNFERAASGLTVYLIKYVNNGLNTLKASVTASSWIPGDGVGFSITGNILRAWIYHAGSWSVIDDVVDNTYTASGRLALKISQFGGSVVLDDVGGGTAGAILASTKTISLNLAAALTTSITLAAAASLVLTVNANLTAGTGLASSVTMSLVALASLTTSITMSASIPLSITAAAVLSTQIQFASAKTLSIIVGATLTTVITFSSSRTLSLLSSATLTTSITFAATATVSISTAASLLTVIPFSASMTLSLSMIGALTFGVGSITGIIITLTTAVAIGQLTSSMTMEPLQVTTAIEQLQSEVSIAQFSAIVYVQMLEAPVKMLDLV